MNSRGIELSVNFLVGFVLAVTIFGMGIFLLYTIFGQAKDLHTLTQDEIDSQVSQMLCSAEEKVCISGNRLPRKPGSLAVFGIYIYNIKPQRETYTIHITDADRSINPSKEYIENELQVVSSTRQVTIDANEQENLGAGIQIPRGTKKGTYVFKAEISPDSGGQAETRLIYVLVK
ncbi:MAG: hypothetical protein ACOCWQ_06285 [Nanoarchaeota archaeon]